MGVRARRNKKAPADVRDAPDTASASASASASAAEVDAPCAKDSSTSLEDAKTQTKTTTTTKGNWSFWSSRRFVLLIGTIIGVLLGTHHIVQNEDAVGNATDNALAWLLSHKDILPGNFGADIERFMSSSSTLSESFAVGMNMASEGYEPHHPVVLVPGVISTSLESWGLNGTTECPSKSHYRKRLWGGWYMIRTMLMEKSCWLQHIMLDHETGLDPPHFKVRSAQGLEAADFFITGYWIWNKIIENLSALGYDINNMFLAAYDWRLSYDNLEVRDSYFTRLKRLIETNYKSTGLKTVIAGHSMGSQVIFYFLKWVEAEGHGDGGPDWVNKYIEAYIDISGSMLGTPKATAALLSGEMRDTIQLNALAVYGLEKFFARHERAELLRSMPGIASMLPKGGNAIWGDLEGAPDDSATAEGPHDSFGNFIRFTDPISEHSSKNLTVEDSFQYLWDHSPEWFSKQAQRSYSCGLAKTRQELEARKNDSRTWSNPLEAALPNAPDLKIYCLYGIGKPTERGYYYKDTSKDDSTPLDAAIDYDHPESVLLSEGDGTISLNTHAMCHRWQDENSKFNPGKAKVTVVEMQHQPEAFDIRGGAETAEHVDILGRTELNELVCKIAAGQGESIKPRVLSNINDWVWKIDLGTD